MNKKNAANQFAKECIVTALMQLLQKQKLSEITISELTSKAGVSRMTYYRNYKNKEDILIQYLEDIFEAYSKEFYEQNFKTQFYDIPNILRCFRYFSLYKDFIYALFVSNMGNVFFKKLSDYIFSIWYNEGDSKEYYYILQSFVGALCNVYLSWISDKSSISEEELAKLIYKIYSK